MPGVSTAVKVRSGPATDATAPASTAFVSGITERGRTDKAYLVRSLADYVREFGDRVSYGAVYDWLQTFFEEGGTRAYVARVVGGAATAGTLNLMDKAGSPLPTIKIDAKGAGAWSSGVQVASAAGTVAGTFKITITYGGLTEVYDNLVTPAEAVRQINLLSAWVTATDLGSATVAPNNQPAVAAATALSAGNDQRGSIVAADYTTALNNRCGIELGAGVAVVPGQASSAVGAALIAHAVTTRRITLLTVAAGTSQAAAITAAQSLKATTGSERAGLIYPWVQIPDGSGGLRTVDPTAYAAGVRARAHEMFGPWQAPAGDIADSRFVVGLESNVTRTEGDVLDDAEVSVIRQIGSAIRMYGWRTLSADEENWKFLNYRDLTNYLEVEAEKRLEQFVFKAIDGRGRLFNKMAGSIVGLLDPIRAAGGLYEKVDPVTGDQIDLGYSVDVGPSVNTTVTIAQGIAAVEAAVRPSPVGALVKFTLTKAAVAAAV